MIDLAAALEAINYHRDEYGDGALIIHRDIGRGRRHDTDSLVCWCCPQVVSADDVRPSGEILGELMIQERLH